MKKKRTQRIPFGFVFEYLAPLEPVVRPMFGCHALYVGKRIVLILRHRDRNPRMNGVWLATSREHHASLKEFMPSMRSIPLLGKAPTNWQMIPEKSPDFESSVIEACALIVRGDPRIGRIPGMRTSRSIKPGRRIQR